MDTALSSENAKEKNFLEPHIGMEFDDDEQAYRFYNEYARRLGFSIRKQNMSRGKAGRVKCRRFVCYKEGYYKGDPLDKHGKHLRTDGRTGCNAHIGIKRLNSGKFCVHRFVAEHNHKLVSSKKVHLLRSQKVAATLPSDSQAHLGSSNANKDDNITLISSTATNSYFPGIRHYEMKAGDAGAIVHYLQKKAAEDPGFFFSVQLDMKDQITNIFWTDGRSEIDFEHFGDVICFDTSYKILGYDRPFALFSGVNHHKQTVILGASFLFSETIETFKWLFGTFKEAMNGKTPKVVLTQQHDVVIKALEEVWPSTAHRLCVWHIYQNATKHLSHVFQRFPSFAIDFGKCMYEIEYEDEFIESWQRMVQNYNLKDDAWLSKLFEERETWALVYGRERFYADMYTTQRSEHMHSAIRTYLSYERDLMSFFYRYERLVKDRRFDEIEADLHACRTTPAVPLSRLLKQAAAVYSPKIYHMFMREFELYVDCTIHDCGNDGTAHVYEVNNVEKNDTRNVRYEPANDKLSCSCKKFEFVGILCSHMLKVLDFMNIKEIPQKYILKRWSKNVKAGIQTNCFEDSSEMGPTVAIAGRRTSLFHTFGQIMTKGSICQQAYDIAIKEAGKLMERLDLACLEKSKDMHSSRLPDIQLQHTVQELHSCQGGTKISGGGQKGTRHVKGVDGSHRGIGTSPQCNAAIQRTGRADGLFPSTTNTEIAAQPPQTTTNGQLHQLPSMRYVSPQFSTRNQEPLVSSSSQVPFFVVDQLHQNG